MNSNQLSSSLGRTVVPKKGSTVNILRLIFPQWIVKKYWKNPRGYKFVGVVLGASILTLLIQYPATAQLFDDAIEGTEVLETYIPGIANAMTFFFQALKFVVFGGGIAGVGGGLYSHVTNRGWENWLPIGTALIVASGMLYFIEQMVFGTGSTT